MAEKRNIFLVGPMGAGKSTIGRKLAQKLHMEFFDSDQEIENRTGVDISWIFDIEGESGFRKREKLVINEIIDKTGIVLSTGGGSVLSSEIRNKLSSRGIVVYLETSIEKQLLRTKLDKKRPLLQIDNNMSIQSVLEVLADNRNPLYESIADITVHMNNKSIKATVCYIINLLKNYSV
ncbi:MAG: shikimate kinase AroK [Buchnera aphidicola (Chaetogeoica yunlongensis)]